MIVRKKETQFRPIHEVLQDKYRELINMNILLSINMNFSGVIYEIKNDSTIFRNIVATSQEHFQIISKISIDNSIGIEKIPKLVSIVPFKNYIYEYREYEGKARLVDVNYILNAAKLQKFK